KGRMRGKLSLGQRGANGSEVLALTPDAVLYRPDIGAVKDLFTFPDRGPSAKSTAITLPTAGTAVRTPGGLALLDVPALGSEAPLAHLALAGGKGAEAFGWMLAPLQTKASIVPLQRGAEGALVVAWSDLPDGPVHGYLVPVRPAAEPSGIVDLDLAPL